MTDIARLGFSVATDQLKKGVDALRRLKPAADQAAAATEKVASASDRAASASSRMASGVTQATGAASRSASGATGAGNAWSRFVNRLNGVPPAANGAKNSLNRLFNAANDNIGRLQATPGNIAAQFQDVGVTAAAGMSPMLIALQQGTQLSAAFAGGGLASLGGAIRQLISPISILTIGIVALVAAGIQMVDWAKLAKTVLNGVADAADAAAPYIIYLGAVMLIAFGPQILTAILSVTRYIAANLVGALVNATIAMFAFAAANPFSAMVLGIGAVIGIAILMGDKLTKILGFDIIAAAKSGINFIIGGFVGGYNTIKKTWSMLPAAIGDAAIQAANNAISAIDRMINKAIKSINGLIYNYNAVFGSDIGMIGEVAGTKFDNPYAGTADKVSGIASAEIGAVQNVDYVGNGMEMGRGFINAAGEWIRGLADGIGKGDKKDKKSDKSSGKTDAEKFSDITAGIQREIDMNKAKVIALGLTADEALKLENRQKYLNQANQKGIALTAGQTTELLRMSDALTTVQLELKNLSVFKKISEGADTTLEQLKQQNHLIGLTGQALAFATAQQDLFNQAKAEGIKLTDPQRATLDGKAEKIATQSEKNRKDQFMKDFKDDLIDQALDYEQQRKELGLFGEELRASQIEYEMLRKARLAHIELTPTEIAAMGEIAKAQADVEAAIQRTTDTINAARDITKSFFQDFRDNLMEGKSLWSSFADAAIGALDRIINKLSDQLFDQAINQLIKVGLSLFGGGFADGGAFNSSGATGFANGGAFTNSVVDRPTAFAFGKGGANLGIMGEAGPEAIMPLKRGGDGSLGVQMYDGGGSRSGGGNVSVDARSYTTLSGALSSKDIVDLQKQQAAATEQRIKKSVVPWLEQYKRDGALN